MYDLFSVISHLLLGFFETDWWNGGQLRLTQTNFDAQNVQASCITTVLSLPGKAVRHIKLKPLS